MTSVLSIEIALPALRFNQFDRHGELLASSTRSLAVQSPVPGALEIDPGAFQKSILSALAECISLSGSPPELISLTGNSEGLALLDSSGDFIRPIITADDARAVPLIDHDNGGSGVQFASTIRKAIDGVKNVDTIINGHMPAQTTPAEMREYADFVSDFVAHVQAAKKAGKTAAEAIKTWTAPAKYKDYAAPDATQATAWAQVIMDESK